MTDNFEKDINVPSKEIIIKFSDGYCIVLENNEISIRENAFTKYCIEYGKQTNELLEFVKKLYLDKKAKEQECEELETMVAEAEEAPICFRCSEEPCIRQERDKYKQALDEIEKLAKHNNFLVRDPFCGTGYRDLSGQILNIINKAKEKQ